MGDRTLQLSMLRTVWESKVEIDIPQKPLSISALLWLKKVFQGVSISTVTLPNRHYIMLSSRAY